MFRLSVVLGGAVSGLWLTLLFAGCNSSESTTTYYHQRDPLAQWRTSEGGSTNTSANNSTSGTATRVRPRAVNLKYPITQAKGKYTIRAYPIWGSATSTAAQLADEDAERYRKAGYEAYVTDLGRMAWITVGSYNDPDDPELIRNWKREYDNYLKRRGGKESDFQKELDRFHEGNGVIGDRPWPVETEIFQMKMKLTQGKITQQEWNAFQEKRTNPLGR